MLAAIVNNVMLVAADPAGKMIMPPVLLAGPAKISAQPRLCRAVIGLFFHLLSVSSSAPSSESEEAFIPSCL